MTVLRLLLVLMFADLNAVFRLEEYVEQVLQLG